MSSVTQLLAKGYRQTIPKELVAELADRARQWANILPDAHIEIADAWWVANKYFLPHGPWPCLMVLTAPDSTIEVDRTMLLQVPGPPDDRVFTVLGNGYHFDPVWWPSLGELEAERPRHLPAIGGAGIVPTITPNVGPAVGALIMLGAERRGRILYSTQGQFSRDQADGLIQGSGDWQAWGAKLARQDRAGEPNFSGILAILLRGLYPNPPYPDQCFTPQGLNVIIPEARYIAPPDGTEVRAVVLLAFDDIACHIGELSAATAQEALTRLPITGASTVTMGHRGQ